MALERILILAAEFLPKEATNFSGYTMVSPPTAGRTAIIQYL
ncbi:hypothetical protein [Rhizobium ruizarguesonis]|nr:hypothetical protein [Rhizobium ruizarguesonis]